jgi:hypothetical protein
MTKQSIVAVAALIALLVPVAALAHEGHPHRFMGTVSAVQDEQLEVKLTDGEVVTFTLNAETIYRQGKTEVVGKLPKVGERVVVSAMPVEESNVMVAETVQLPVPATASR